MTPLTRLRDELAHAHRDKSDIVNEDWNSFSSFKSGFDAGVKAERENTKGLVEALKKTRDIAKDMTCTQSHPCLPCALITLADIAIDAYKATV